MKDSVRPQYTWHSKPLRSSSLSVMCERAICCGRLFQVARLVRGWRRRRLLAGRPRALYPGRANAHAICAEQLGRAGSRAGQAAKSAPMLTPSTNGPRARKNSHLRKAHLSSFHTPGPAGAYHQISRGTDRHPLPSPLGVLSIPANTPE